MSQKKSEIIDLVQNFLLPFRQTLVQFTISTSTIYNWYEGYREEVDGALVESQPKTERM